MTRKTLYIHAGGPKTGTSSIQSFLGTIASHLTTYDWSYEHSPDTTDANGSNCGNGLPVYDLLTADNFTQAALDDLLVSYCGPCTNAICSSEYFSSITPTHWKELYESSKRLDIHLNVVFYVRDVIPFMLSAYDQHIKNHYEQGSFDSWVEQADYPKHWQHATALRSIEAVLPNSSIRVIHYKERSCDVIESFLSLVGLEDLAAVERHAVRPRFNRSLTAKEREILLAVNRTSAGLAGKAARSKELADLLIHAQPHLEGECDACSSVSISTLTARFVKDVDWINDTFFRGGNVVSVVGSIVPQDCHETCAPTNGTDNSIDHIALGWALTELASIQTRAQHELLNRLNAIAKEYTDYYLPLFPRLRLPDDFDVIAYVLLNRDVLLAGIDPVQHFIGIGMAEGRSYRFFERRPTVGFENDSHAISHEAQES